MKPKDVIEGIKAAAKLADLNRHYMSGYNDVKVGRLHRVRESGISDDQWLAYRAGRMDAEAGRRPRGGTGK